MPTFRQDTKTGNSVPLIKTDDINNKAITKDKIRDGNVTSEKLEDGSVSSNKISNGAVNSSKLADGSVSTPKLAAKSVTNEKIAYESVSRAELNSELRKSIDAKADADEVSKSLDTLEKKIGERFVVEGDVTNLPDEEDLTSAKESERDVLKLADRSYTPGNFIGNGYKILRRNIHPVLASVTKIRVESIPSSDGTLSFIINGKETSVSVTASTDNTTSLVAQKVVAALKKTMLEYEVSIDTSLITLTGKLTDSLTPPTFSASNTNVVCTINSSTKQVLKNILEPDKLNQPNTIYEIRYDFDLDGMKVILNKGVSLCLVGGDIKNGKIVCNNTRIYGNGRLSCELYGTYFYEGKADGVELIETSKGISFKDNITYNAKNNKRNKVFLRPGINYKSLMYPKEIIEEYSLAGDDRYMVNTDYFLLGNIDLGGKDSSHWINFGKGCSLTNLGGSIYNGLVSFKDLKIIGKYPFRDLTDNSSLESEINVDEYSNIDLSKFINTSLQYTYRLVIRLGVGKYELSAPITIPKNKTVVIIGSGKTKYTITNKLDYDNYNSNGTLLTFNNIDKKYKNISVFSGEGILCIENTSLCLLEEDVSYKLNDNPKPSDFNSLSLGNTNINGINVANLSINNCSLFCFTNVGIVIKQAFQIIENTDILYSRTGIEARINLTGDEQFLNIYIRKCEIGMHLNGGHINISKLWIDEITKYGIVINDNSSIRILDLHINHCNYAGIKVNNFDRAMIIGTINRCGCYYAGIDIKDVPEVDLDKCCNIYADSCTNSTLMFNSSYMVIDDPNEQSNYGQVSAPVIDIIADNFSYNNVFLNSNLKNKIYSSNSQKTYALCKIKTQYNNNFVVNNGVECNISDGKYVIETSKIGNTNNRPNLDDNSIGFDYYDTTLKKKILWNGSAWVNLDGTELS